MFPPIGAEITENVTTTLPEIEARIIEALTFQMAANLEREQSVIQAKLSGEVLKVRSGKLLGSVRIDAPTVSPGLIEGGVQAGADAPEGVFQEYGTQGPYVIEARVAKALAFEVGGQTVFAKHVVHPGLPARSFMQSTADELRDEEQESYQAAVARALA